MLNEEEAHEGSEAESEEEQVRVMGEDEYYPEDYVEK